MSAGTAPILQGVAASDALTWGRGAIAASSSALSSSRSIAANAFCGAAIELARHLPRARFAFNLCDRTPNFLLGYAAALAAGQTLLLPPSRLAASLADIRREYPDSYCLIDADADTYADPDAVGPSAVRVAVDAARAAAGGASDVSWPPFEISLTQIAAVLFTSGSTRAPQPQAKTWGELVGGTQTLLRTFDHPAAGTRIIGTVAPQHMFGFETTVMLPLQSGTPVLETRPVYPGDLEQVVAMYAGPDPRTGVGTPVWLMTTPLQLRVFHQALPRLSGLARIITATMPLDRDLARSVERDWGVRVDEIFGCTEGGILATRRPARTPLWNPAAGLSFSVDAEQRTQVDGGHLPGTLTLNDRIRLVAAIDDERADASEIPLSHNRAFELLGRDEDIVKIAGKRASLRGLNEIALAVVGVRDAHFFRPDPDTLRLAAIVVAPGRTGAALQVALSRVIDPAFLPRPLIVAERLERDGNGKVTRATLERLLNSARGSLPLASAATPTAPAAIERVWSVPADHPALAGHFPGRPIVPGAMLLDAIAIALAESGFHVRECVQVKFLAPVTPETRLVLDAKVSAGGDARFVVRCADTIAVSGRLRCGGERIEGVARAQLHVDADPGLSS